MFIKDREGRYRFINPAGAARLDRPVAAILGRRDADLLTAETARRVADEERRVLATGKARTIERAARGDGGLQSWFIEIAPCHDVDGGIVGIVGVGRDAASATQREDGKGMHPSGVTASLDERLTALADMRAWWQQALANAANVMGQIQSLQARLSQLESNPGSDADIPKLAHELKQPLLAIHSYAEACLSLAGSGPDTDSALMAALEDLVGQTHRATEIARRLRRAEHRGRTAALPTQINELVHATLPLVRLEAQLWSVELVLELTDSLPPVQADPIQIEQVLINLIVNGIEAATRGTGEKRVTIRTTQSTQGRIEVAILDTGPGISAEMQGRLFEPYVTTKEDGTGLGLAISRTLVEVNGGELRAANREASGAALSFTLPVSHAISHGPE